MTNWVQVKVLGGGSYGTVYLAKPTTGPLDYYFAVKTACLQRDCSLSKEEQILKHFKGCPEIVQCLGSETTKLETDTCSTSFYNLKLEYAAGGTLADLIIQRKKLPENEVKEYLKIILRGLSCLHYDGFVHADLKPANILAFPQSNGKMKLKIADFGLSMKSGERGEDGSLRMFKGTPKYMSPESVVFSEYESALDIWSLGCILIEMVSGKSVWNDCLDLKELIRKLVHEKGVPKIPEELCEEGKDFIRRCFVRNPKRRWTADMLLQHPYLREEKESVRKDYGKPKVSELENLESKIIQSRNGVITKLPGLPKFPKELYLPHLQARLRSCIQT